MVSDKMCVICDNGVREDVADFLVDCGGFERDRLVLLDDVCRIMGTRESLDEFLRVEEEKKVALLLGKGVEGICNRVIVDVGECILHWLGRWWQRRKQLLYRLLLGIDPPLTCPLSPLEQLDRCIAFI